MRRGSTPDEDRRGLAVAAATMTVGVLVVTYGVLLLSTSLLGGVHVAAIGGCLVLSGVFATEWSGRQFALAPRHRRAISFAFAAIAILLTAAFLALNLGAFDGSESTR